MKFITRQTIHSIVGLLFVISGALGLIYQIVWFKYLSLFLGNTTYAQAIVLATFMGGLAIGAARWGRKVDHAKHPLRLYAYLELGIGIYCLLYPKFLVFLKSVFIWSVISLELPSDGTSVLFLKLGTSFCMLILPTILMGGTLPVLVRFISHKLEELGKNVAILYFLNSFGAVVGSLLAGFFFIRILGLSATIYSAATINLFIGSLALVMSMWTKPLESNEVEEIKGSAVIFSHREIILAIVVAGISGLASMIYEVTWVRLLIPVIGSSTYSFSLMLVAFISGITIGSLIISALVQRVKNLFSLLAGCQIGIVLSMLAVLPLYARIPYEFWKAASILSQSDTTYPLFLIIQFFLCFILMIVPTIFLGMSLPLATRIAARGIDVVGTSVGHVFAINTFGTVVGSLSAGLILIPLVGVKHTIEIGIGCNLLAGMVCLLSKGTIPRRQAFRVIPVVLLSLIVYSVFSQNWSRGTMLSGVFRRIIWNLELPKSYSEFKRQVNSPKVLYYKEGTTATVGVSEADSPDGVQRTLIINGKSDASSKGDLPTQILLGQLPCLLHQNPQNALVIGLGSGVTLGSILTHPIKHVDCVEISPEVAEASCQFNEVNHQPLRDSRTKLFIEDALAYLNFTPRMYDLIVSEPSNPWIAGVGNLYTTEFFEVCKRRMNTHGLMIQWFHIYEMNDDLFKMVMRTFQSSFKYVSIWQPTGGDVILLGSGQPLSVDFIRLQTTMAYREIKEDLQRISIPDAATLLSLEMLSSESVSRYSGVGDLNTEDHPHLEYDAPEAFFTNKSANRFLQCDERLRCDSVSIQLRKWMEHKQLTDEELRNIGFFHTNPRQGYLSFGYSVLHALQSKHPEDVALLKRLAATAERLNLHEEALTYYKELVKLGPTDPNALENYAWLKYLIEHQRTTILTLVDTKECEDLLQKSINLVADTVDRYRLKLGDIFYGTQRFSKAKDQYTRAIKIRSTYHGDPNVHDDIVFLQLARCFRQLGQNENAFGFAMQAVNINPQNEEAKDLVYELWISGSKKTLIK